jgi:elongation factor Ts
MPEISAKAVMNLRNKTGLPMMDCKQALAETNGDEGAAEEWLRKKLKGKMDTRTERAAGEGRIEVAITDRGAAIVELRAETDFTAKNERFLGAAKKIAEAAVAAGGNGRIEPSAAMTAVIDDIRVTTGENASISRIARADGGSGTVFGSYIHHDGKTGVLVVAEGAIKPETLREIGMHIVASPKRPLGVSADDLPKAAVEKERKFRIEQAMESGKPKEIAEKMVEGGMRKFYEEVALLEQPFVKDETRKVKDVVGAGGKIRTFYRWAVGEQA